jgi:putative lipoprotein
MTWVLAFSLALSPTGDSWFGRDKAKHLLAAAAVQSLAYTAWREAGMSSRASLWGATAATGVVSISKEVVDRRQGRTFSRKDLVWDAAGAGTSTVAIILLRER